MSGGKGFADFANPAGWSSGACLGALLPEDDSKLPVLFRRCAEFLVLGFPKMGTTPELSKIR